MSTGELERLERVERLLENALHESDHVAVDRGRGRAMLELHVDERQRSVRRLWLICVAASVLAVIVTTSMLLAGPLGQKDSLPAAPSPELTLSPSGLPVGMLRGKVDRTETEAKSTVRIIVRADGTGVFNAGTVGDSAGDSTADLPVEFVKEGPGSARMRYHGDCFTPETLTLEFTVRGRTVVIQNAYTNDCLVNRGLASDMAGTTLRLLPLPTGQ
jgi:hypothetical protein